MAESLNGGHCYSDKASFLVTRFCILLCTARVNTCLTCGHVGGKRQRQSPQEYGGLVFEIQHSSTMVRLLSSSKL